MTLSGMWSPYFFGTLDFYSGIRKFSSADSDSDCSLDKILDSDSHSGPKPDSDPDSRTYILIVYLRMT